MKWYRRNFNLQSEVLQDDLREYFNDNISLLDLNKNSVLNSIGRIQEHEGNQSMYDSLYFPIKKTIQVFGVLLVLLGTSVSKWWPG